jgi:hypothetical protein
VNQCWEHPDTHPNLESTPRSPPRSPSVPILPTGPWQPTQPAQTMTPDTLMLHPDLSLAPPLSCIPWSPSLIGLRLSPDSPSFLRPRPPSSTSFYWALYALLSPCRKSGYTPTRSLYCSATPLLPGVYSRTPECSLENSPQSMTLTCRGGKVPHVVVQVEVPAHEDHAGPVDPCPHDGLEGRAG